MPENAEGVIVITPAEMYATTQRDMGAIRAALEDLKLTLIGVPQKLEDHETRIRRLEEAKWLIAGMSAALGTTIGAIATKVLGG